MIPLSFDESKITRSFTRAGEKLEYKFSYKQHEWKTVIEYSHHGHKYFTWYLTLGIEILKGDGKYHTESWIMFNDKNDLSGAIKSIKGKLFKSNKAYLPSIVLLLQYLITNVIQKDDYYSSDAESIQSVCDRIRPQ